MEAKVPPNNKQVEMNLLGILMVVPGSVVKVKTVLKVKDFYQPMYQDVYQAVMNLSDRGEATDMVSVATMLHKMKSKVELSELTKATNLVTGDLALEGYVRTIKEKSILRRVINLTSEYNNMAYNESSEPNNILGSLISQVSAIMQEQQGKNVEHISDVIVKAIAQMEAASKREGNLIGIPSSITALSKLTLGYAAPDLTILAAGTSEGKSTFMLNEAKTAAKEGKNVVIFTLEMSNIQLVMKVFNDELNIDMIKIRTGKLSREEWAELTGTVVKKLSELNIYLYDIGGLSIVEFISIVKQLKAKYGEDFIVFLDYLQLMTTVGVKEKFQNREAQVSYISRQLKATCKNENIPIVALSQLSRIKEKRMYVKSDLRESGAIEQDADKIFFIWRPYYHKVKNDENGKQYDETDAFIQVEKERLGETGIIPVKFNGRYSRFEDKETGNWKKVEQEVIPTPKNNTGVMYTDYVPPIDDTDDLPF